MHKAILIAIVLISASSGFADTIHVPEDYPTIQEAINAAPGNHDLILVSEGVYSENIRFNGKAVFVRSDRDGDDQTLDMAPFDTIIDGYQLGSVVSFTHGEGNDSVLQGFTLMNGSGTLSGSGFFGGGIYCSDGSSPTIHNCVVSENQGRVQGSQTWEIEAGAGIFCGNGSSPLLLNTLIHNNLAYGASWGHGGGIACWKGSNPLLVNCTIARNQAHPDSGQGGGLWCFNGSQVEIWNTIFAENEAFDAHGIWVGTDTTPSSVHISYSTIMTKNGYNPPHSTFVQSGCLWEEHTVFDRNPWFKDSNKKDFGLSTGSYWCIGRGSNEAPYLEYITTDIHGSDRIMRGIKSNGNMDDLYVVDIGCDEYQPLYVPDSFTSITAALHDASDYDTVIVKPGTYFVNLNFNGARVSMRSDKDGKISTIVDQSPQTTILDGSRAGSVVTQDQVDYGSLEILGFTITNGLSSKGGGVFCSDSMIRLENCILESNEASHSGGAICSTANGDVFARDCIIRENTSGMYGGAVCFIDGWENSSLRDCIVEHNTCELYGGAVASRDAFGRVRDSIVRNNYAMYGSGIYMSGDSLRVESNQIYDNGYAVESAELYGGGIYAQDVSDGRIFYNLFYQNHADYGGGLYCMDSDDIRIESNSFYMNTAKHGGGIFLSHMESEILNNTLYKNYAYARGGGIYAYHSYYSLISGSIIWDCISPMGAAAHFEDGVPTVAYCDVSDGASYPWYDPTNSIDAHPLWLNDSDPTKPVTFLHLDRLSPCINMGSSEYFPLRDIDSEKRPFYGTPDIGSDEYTESIPFLLAPPLVTDLDPYEYEIYVLETEYKPVQFLLNATVENAGRPYYLLGSLSGTAPGVTGLPENTVLPLNWDVFTEITVSACLFGSPVFVDFHGVLDAKGKGIALLEYDGLLTYDMVGMVMSFSFALGSEEGFTAWDYTSNPVNIIVREVE